MTPPAKAPSSTVYTDVNPHLWLVRHLSVAERERRQARAEKRCRFGHAHHWMVEIDMDKREATEWVRCSNCTAVKR